MFQDEAYVNGVRSDVASRERCHSEVVQVLTAARGRGTHRNAGVQQQDVLTSVKVECVLRVSFVTVKYNFMVKISIYRIFRPYSTRVIYTKNI
jgi:hypothetical protein